MACRAKRGAWMRGTKDVQYCMHEICTENGYQREHGSPGYIPVHILFRTDSFSHSPLSIRGNMIPKWQLYQNATSLLVVIQFLDGFHDLFNGNFGRQVNMLEPDPDFFSRFCFHSDIDARIRSSARLYDHKLGL